MSDHTKITNRRDILLLLLYSPGKTGEINEPITGRTRLVKMLFLFKYEVLPQFHAGTDISEENFYKFYPWHFGPFSVQVYDDISFFQLRGFIESKSSEEESLPEAVAEWDKWRDEAKIDDDVDIFEEESFKLTDRGVTFTKIMFNPLSQNQRNLLTAFKAKLSNAPLRAILRYVYQRYPEQIINSTIKSEVLGDVN